MIYLSLWIMNYSKSLKNNWTQLKSLQPSQSTWTTLKIFFLDTFFVKMSFFFKILLFSSQNISGCITKEICITKTHISTTDLILTNKPLSFQSSSVIETGLTDNHKLIAIFVKSHFARLNPKTVYYRNLKSIDEKFFLNDCKKQISNCQQMIQMKIIVSSLILSLTLSKVMHLWKKIFSEEIKPLLWTRNWQKRYILEVG